MSSPGFPARRSGDRNPSTPLVRGGGRGANAVSILVDGGALLLAVVAMWPAPRELAWESPRTILFWFGLVLLASLIPLRLRMRGGGEIVSPSATPVLALGLVLGPSPGALAGALSGLVSGLMLRNASWAGRLRLSSRTALAGAAGARLFLWGGGFAYPGLANSLFELGGADIVPLLLAGLGFYGTYAGLASIQIALRENLSLARVLRANARALGLVSVSYFILGLLMALAYLRVGAGSAALLLPALVVTQGSLKNQLDLERARASAIRALSSAIDARDPYTRGHSERVRAFAVRVARHLGLSESTVEALEVAALLHDLGKVSIDPGVLGKPAPLSADERAQMHAHADAGARVMGEMAYLARHADMVRCHHERLDGGGYPRGLNSEEIPLGARILHVVDALDAMTSDRPYRRALPLAEASRELSVCAGTQFDENVVRAVLELLDRGELKPPATSPSEEDAGGPPSAGDEPSAGGGDESRNHGVQGVNREDHSMAPDR